MRRMFKRELGNSQTAFAALLAACALALGLAVFAAPDAAYFPRSQGGPGIPENTVTLCFCCRARIDNGSETAGIRERLRRYLKSRYPGWDDQIWKDRKG